MQSQIPPVVARYFELRGVDVAENHPYVNAIFRPGRGGWQPVIRTSGAVRVTHLQLVKLRDKGVTGVQFAVNGYQGRPDFSLDELVGKMTPLDAEMTDGLPLTEGSGVVADRGHMVAVLTELGFKLDEAYDALDRADSTGIEFTSERRSFSAVDARGAFEEGWRYRLVSRAQITGGGPGYELSVLTYERKDA